MSVIKSLFITCCSLVGVLSIACASEVIEFSKAGYFDLENSGREVFNFNAGWRFHKGTVAGAEAVGFDDSEWEIVNCPHGLELNTDQVSGGGNYQGEAWYRKHFTYDTDASQRRTVLHFEAVMGKSKVWLNGELLGVHFGGFLPFEVDLSEHLIVGQKNVLVVLADNSNDESYPPGKPQETMDFTYLGGIYRDVWLVSTNRVHVSNPNAVDLVAGGGVFAHVENFSKTSADVIVRGHFINHLPQDVSARVEMKLKHPNGEVVASETKAIAIQGESDKSISQTLAVVSPDLWNPWSPSLYDLEIRLIANHGTCLDGVRLKVGIRNIEFKGKDGLFLNDEPYPGKLVGANRHQDHGYVGNAMPNNKTIYDAIILKRGACDIVRAAHYPADPAFMDACDQLGMFFIVATPGWQFWNEDPIFEQRVHSDIRNMVRRDRNHPSVILWEPILNETWYPAEFAKEVCDIVHEEYPYQGAYTASDRHAKGGEASDVTYSHQYVNGFWQKAIPVETGDQAYLMDYSKEKRSVFTREWGDCVDNWGANNSPSRAARDWGERAQIIQALHYEHSDMVTTDWETLYETPRQHVGGTFWHSFDHQRGYHTDPFFGGFTDVFRQPKYVYQLFQSQRDVDQSEPFIYIAHEMTPFSEPDVHVFTNCDEVRLTLYEDKVLSQNVSDMNRSMPHPVVTFEGVYDFLDVKRLDGARQHEKVKIVAEGLVDGNVVASCEKQPAQEASAIRLERLDPEIQIEANGSDFVTVIATLVDRFGNEKRLNNDFIYFEVLGEGELIDNGKIGANPRKIEWGTAPALVRASTTSGEIIVRARMLEDGLVKPTSAELRIQTTPARDPMVFSEERVLGKVMESEPSQMDASETVHQLKQKVEALEKELSSFRKNEVIEQQTDFVGGK